MLISEHNYEDTLLPRKQEMDEFFMNEIAADEGIETLHYELTDSISWMQFTSQAQARLYN